MATKGIYIDADHALLQRWVALSRPEDPESPEYSLWCGFAHVLKYVMITKDELDKIHVYLRDKFTSVIEPATRDKQLCLDALKDAQEREMPLAIARIREKLDFIDQMEEGWAEAQQMARIKIHDWLDTFEEFCDLPYSDVLTAMTLEAKEFFAKQEAEAAKKVKTEPVEVKTEIKSEPMDMEPVVKTETPDVKPVIKTEPVVKQEPVEMEVDSGDSDPATPSTSGPSPAASDPTDISLPGPSSQTAGSSLSPRALAALRTGGIDLDDLIDQMTGPDSQPPEVVTMDDDMDDLIAKLSSYQ